MAEGPPGRATCAVATAGGIVTIAPHCFAQGVFGGADSTRGTDMLGEYTREGMVAFNVYTKGWDWDDLKLCIERNLSVHPGTC